jgi:tetratricopeptide (TPR) repeat protein
MTTLAEMLERAAAAVEQHEYGQAIEQYSQVLASTDPQTADPTIKETRLIAWRGRGNLLRLVGEQEAALASYQQYYLEAGTSKEAVEALVLQGDQQSRIGRNDLALETFLEALQLAEALNYTAGRAKALAGMGLAMVVSGQTEEAISRLKKALPLFEQLHDRLEQARVWNGLGYGYHGLGQIDKAIIAYKTSIEIAEALGEQEVMIYGLGNLGEAYQNLFDMQQALFYHQLGLVAAERTGLPYLLVDLYRNLGVNLCYLGRVEEGIAYLERALVAAEETTTPVEHLQTLYSLAYAELQRGNPAAAYDYAWRLKDEAEKSQALVDLVYGLYVLGMCHQRQGDGAAAEQVWQQGIFLAHQTGQRMILWQIHAGLAEVAANRNLAAVHRRIAAEVIQQIAFPIEDETVRQKFLSAPAVQAILRQGSLP